MGRGGRGVGSRRWCRIGSWRRGVVGGGNRGGVVSDGLVSIVVGIVVTIVVVVCIDFVVDDPRPGSGPIHVNRWY